MVTGGWTWPTEQRRPSFLAGIKSKRSPRRIVLHYLLHSSRKRSSLIQAFPACTIFPVVEPNECRTHVMCRTKPNSCTRVFSPVTMLPLEPGKIIGQNVPKRTHAQFPEWISFAAVGYGMVSSHLPPSRASASCACSPEYVRTRGRKYCITQVVFNLIRRNIGCCTNLALGRMSFVHHSHHKSQEHARQHEGATIIKIKGMITTRGDARKGGGWRHPLHAPPQKKNPFALFFLQAIIILVGGQAARVIFRGWLTPHRSFLGGGGWRWLSPAGYFFGDG